MKKKCKFNKSNTCYALACYSGELCSAKDKKGNIRYSDTFDRKRKISQQRRQEK